MRGFLRVMKQRLLPKSFNRIHARNYPHQLQTLLHELLTNVDSCTTYRSTAVLTRLASALGVAVMLDFRGRMPNRLPVELPQDALAAL